LPTVSGNSATFGGGLAVVDQDEWGGNSTELPSTEIPDNVPSAVLDHGVLTANESSTRGGAVMAYGGSAVGFSGPLSVAASNTARDPGTDGVAVTDAYLHVSGDVVTEVGGGVALLKEGWPVVLTSGFTGLGRLVIEEVQGLREGKALNAIRLADPLGAFSAQALEAIRFAITGLEVAVEQTSDGQLVLRGSSSESSEPSARPSPSQPGSGRPTIPPSSANPPLTSAPPAQPSSPPGSTTTPPSSSAVAPTAVSSEPTTAAPTVQAGSAQTSAILSGTSAGSQLSGGSDSDAVEVPASPNIGMTGSVGATDQPTRSSASASRSDAVAGGDEPNLTVPEPPAGVSSRMIGFSLMAIGIFGLAGLGVYVMRRGGFFVA
jgi:hypothetical protein